MVLKKQTVWLLTMLSLVIVLSVYYVTSPGDQYALMTNEEEQEGTEEQAAMENEDSMNGAEVAVEELEDGTYVSSTSSDELLTQLRLQIDEERARLREELQTVAASVEVTAEEKSKALDKIQTLHDVATKEKILETLIRADKSYADALVKAEGNEVRVIVNANEKSKKAANQIMQMVRDEMGNKMVRVEFHPVK